MGRSVTIYEQRHDIWRKGTFASAVLTILFFILFWNISDPLWIGILRLVTFIFFTLTVFGTLKLMEPPMEVELSFNSNYLLISYVQNEKEVLNEQFDRSAIQSILPTSSDLPFWTHYLHPQSAILKVDFKGKQHKSPLIKYRGRPLLFKQDKLSDVQKWINKEQQKFNGKTTS